MKYSLKILCALAISSMGLFAAENQKGSAKPNIIIIFADDLGYGDLSCYGATQIQTPNLDRLASEGMQFSDAHAAASVCSPSRYGLLTGRSPWRLGKKGNGYSIEKDRLTIAGMLKTQGYTSAAIGKWHLGYSKDWNKLPITGPLEVGFDYHFGVPKNHNDDTRAYIENHDLVGREEGVPYRIVKGRDFPEGLAKPRVEDEVDGTLTQKAVEFIQKNSEDPFFLYLALCCPHTHVTPAAAFRGTSQAGLYGDYVHELDSHVATIMSTLDELKIADNTLLIFTSDNGSTPKDFKGTQGVNLKLADESGNIREKFKTAKEDAKKLGHVTNGPWKDGKGYPAEGGHRIPFIARWPGKIQNATSSDYTFCLTDLFATAAEILEADLPTNAAEDSISLLPVLLDQEPVTPLRKLAIIQGDTKDNALVANAGNWKLIQSKDEEGNPTINELYDLSSDPGETKNIASEHPEKVKELSTELAQARANGRTRPE